MEGLEFVKEIADRIATLEQRRRNYVLRIGKEIDETKDKLDAAMLAAVDFGGYDPLTVSRIAGYKGDYAVKNARRREKERRIEVR